MKISHLKYVLHAAVLVGLVVAGAKYLNGEELIEAVKKFDYSYAPIMLALSAGYLLLKSWRFVLLMRPVSDLPWGVVFKGFAAGQAATLLPGGVAARAGIMNQVGVSVATSSAPVAFSSGLDQVVFIVGSLVAALWFEDVRLAALIVMSVLAFIGLIALIPATRHWVADAADWLAEKLGIGEQWQNFLEAVPEVATPRVMATTMAVTLVLFAIKLVMLDLCIRGVGQTVSPPTLFLAFILPTMLGRLFPVPGGVGVTEAGMVGFLVSTAQINTNTATAAVAIFRVVTVLFQALLGALVYFFFWDGREEVEEAPPARS